MAKNKKEDKKLTAEQAVKKIQTLKKDLENEKKERLKNKNATASQN